MQSFIHVFLCVSVPIGMGLVLYAAFGVWDRRGRRADPERLPPIDYHI